MVVVGTGAAAVAGAALFALVVAAGAALFAGLRARGQARAVIADRARLEALLRGAPAVPMVVRPDGRVQMPRRMADWLGLAAPPRLLPELAGERGTGLAPADAAALAADVAAAQRAGRPFQRSLRASGSARSLTFRGARGAGGVVVWGFDATDSEGEIARLNAEVARLAAAHDALSAVVEAAPLPIWYRGPDLRLAMVNSAYVGAVEGRDAAEVVAREAELVEGSDQGGPLAGAAAARDGRRLHARVLPATVAGERRRLRVLDVPLADGGVAGYALDVDELMEARGDQQRLVEAQRLMLDRLSAAVIQFGPDGRLVFCNQPFRRLFAMRTEWLADRPGFERVLERMREAGRLPEVRDFPAWRDERRGWFQTSEAAVEENWHLPGGTHLRVIAQPLPGGGLLLVIEDRTEAVQLASARDTLLRVRAATFDNLFEALGVFAADGRLQLWNNRFRRLWGVEEEFLAGHPRVDAFAAAIADRLATPARAALIPELVRSATGERQGRGGRVAFADGRHFEFAAVPLPDGNALFTLLDITDSRRAEEALRERADALEAADRAKTRFVATVSYELRTPLTSIGGFAEMLYAGYAGPLTAEARQYVQAILDSVERLGLLVDDVLDLTVSEGGEQRVDVDLAATVRAAAATVAPSARRRGLELEVEVARSVGRVTGDPRRLREAVEHLLRHAVAGTSAGGHVRLRAAGDATRARVAVADDGPGMDAQSAAHAFDRFAGAGLQPGGERALGLGLPLARQFAEAHGGTVQLASRPGAGTETVLELPRR